MLAWVLLIIFFWAVVPGLITGWMLGERGRSFLPGLLLGAVCGPLGILGTLVFIYVSDRRRARDRQHVRGRAVRVFYEIPVVGRLHVSTVWALAGLATFLCLWMVGGISYEFYKAEMRPAAGEPEQAARVAAESAGPKALVEPDRGAAEQPADPRLNAQAQSNTSAQTRSSLVGSLSNQPGQAAQTGARADNVSTGWQPPPPTAGGPTPATAQQQAAVSSGPAVSPANAAPAPAAPPAQAPAQSRADAVADVTRDLAARGHRVHAALSGDSRTATLSLTGATLTRAAGNQILGNGRLRGALKAAGVRIVVLLNGEESWTYIL
ncbi:MAG TPA: hypothetical protein VF588_11035 [Pyrinomonadaceae bacterium]|jgi:hypothetical protein